MAKLNADRAYVNRVVEDAAQSIQNIAANSIVANATASTANAAPVEVAASRLFGRGSTGNVAPLTVGGGIEISGTVVQLSGLQISTFVSSEQTITSGGSLTLAHGLSGAPYICTVKLVCTTAEFNYSIGDVYHYTTISNATSNGGVAVIPDATNLNIRYGSAINTFIIHNKTTGATGLANNSRWNAVFTAVYWE